MDEFTRKITAEFFEEHVGRSPVEDDLERCNCELAGTFGHYKCGWCGECNIPMFMCSHIFIKSSRS